MKKWLLLAILALPSLCYSQGVRFDNIALQAANPLQGIPNAVITVCTSAGTGKPCAPLATTYTDATLATPCPGGAQVTLAGSNTCVSTGDSLGNFGFWLAANATYIYTVTAPGLPGYSTSITISCPTSGNCTFTGNVTFTNIITGSVTGNAATATTAITATNLAGPGAITGNYTSTGTLTLNQLQGCQYVNATQTFAQALAAVSNPGCIVITPGTYTVAANSTIAAGIDLISISGGVLSIANTFTLTINGGILAPATPSAPLFAYVGSGVVAFGAQAMPINPLWMPGADFGAQTNNAYTAGASTGVHIHISPGVYNFTSPLLFATANKPVFLECAPGVVSNQTTNASTTQLNFTPTSGTAMTINTSAGSKITSCDLTGAGTGNSTIGVLLGGVNSCIYCVLDKLDISGFGVGLQFGNNVYIASIDNPGLHDNGTNFLVPSGATGVGENIGFKGGSISNKGSAFNATCINIQAQGDYHFWNLSIDQCGITINAVNVFVDYTGVHTENPNGTTTAPFVLFGTACNFCTWTSTGGEMLEDGTAGARTEFIKDTSSISNHAVKVNIYGGSFIPGESVAQLANLGAGTQNCCAQGFAANWQNGFGGSTFTKTFGGSNFGIYDLSNVAVAGIINFGPSSNPATLLPGNFVAGNPTILSGFNTGTCSTCTVGVISFSITIGSGGAGSTGAITLPAAPSGWNCHLDNFNRAALIAETGNSATSATFTNYGTTFSATNWTNGDILIGSCWPH